MSPPIPPRSSMESIVDAAVKRATEDLRRDLEDAQRHIRELQGVDETVHETLGKLNERATAKSGAYKDLLGTQKVLDEALGSSEARQSSFETFVRNELGTVKAQVGSLVNRVPVTEGVIRQAVNASDLAEQRSADVVVAQNSARLAIEGMRWKIIAGAIVSIVLGVTTIAANAYITLSRGDAIERHVDERLKTTDERLDRALPK